MELVYMFNKSVVTDLHFLYERRSIKHKIYLKATNLDNIDFVKYIISTQVNYHLYISFDMYYHKLKFNIYIFMLYIAF